MTTGHSTIYGGGGGSGGSPSGLGSTAVSGLQQVVPAVASTPGWTVVGDYFYIAGKVSLEFIALPSNSAITCRCKLFDTVTHLDVAGSILSIGPGVTADTRAISGDLSGGMVANRLYQIQVEGTGGATQADFCTMRTARILES